MATTKAPNYATVSLTSPPGSIGQWNQGPKEEVVQNFVAHRFNSGVLIFDIADGSIVAYGAGQWTSVEMTHVADK